MCMSKYREKQRYTLIKFHWFFSSFSLLHFSLIPTLKAITVAYLLPISKLDVILEVTSITYSNLDFHVIGSPQSICHTTDKIIFNKVIKYVLNNCARYWGNPKARCCRYSCPWIVQNIGKKFLSYIKLLETKTKQYRSSNYILLIPVQ